MYKIQVGPKTIEADTQIKLILKVAHDARKKKQKGKEDERQTQQA